MTDVDDHDYKTCKVRYCLICFFIDQAIHPLPAPNQIKPAKKEAGRE